MKHVVCLSGGESSAIAAVEVARRHGTDGLVLLNHDLCASVELPDIKRFKNEVAEYIGVPITFANIGGKATVDVDQFDVCIDARAFSAGGHMLCTNRLKTAPFMRWIENNADKQNTIIYYGFDVSETARVQRRIGIMGGQGWRTDYPLLWRERTLQRIADVGITPPLTYCRFRHANCVGCLKAGMQHWYVVYCQYPEIWNKAKAAEDEIGFAMHKDGDGKPVYLDEVQGKFENMRKAGIPATEKIPAARFWASANRVADGGVLFELDAQLPCECVI